jgi:hypothetical protein
MLVPIGAVRAVAAARETIGRTLAPEEQAPTKADRGRVATWIGRVSLAPLRDRSERWDNIASRRLPPR